MKKSFAVFFSVSLVLSLMFSNYVLSVGGDDYLDAWQYRKRHTITHATGAGTDYQVKLIVYYGYGADWEDEVYLQGKCNEDFGDIRFTDDDRITLLDYWMEEMDPANYATFWVEIADDISSSSTTIYIYYGNSEASTTSNGTATFVEFEDFSGDSQSMTLYNPDASKIEISHDTANDWLECEWKTSSSSTYKLARAYWSAVSSGHAIRMNYYRATPEDLAANKHYSMFLIDDWSESDPGAASADLAGSHIWSGGASYPPSRCADSSLNSGNAEGSGVYYISLDAWNVYEVTWSDSNVTTYWNDTFHWSTTSSVYVPDESLYPVVGGSRGSGTTTSSSYAYWDWVLVRKFVEDEPEHGYWWDEEVQGSGWDKYWLSGWAYRKSHVITSAEGATTNYQVRIIVSNGAGASSGDLVQLNGKAKGDYGDIRFTDNDGETLLDYWIEENWGYYAVFWVEVKDWLGGYDRTIYIYYGNPDANTTSNGTNTFVFFDDFSSDTSGSYVKEADKYYGSGDASISWNSGSEWMEITRSGNNGLSLFYGPGSVGSGYAVDAKVRYTGTADTEYVGVGVRGDTMNYVSYGSNDVTGSFDHPIMILASQNGNLGYAVDYTYGYTSSFHVNTLAMHDNYCKMYVDYDLELNGSCANPIEDENITIACGWESGSVGIFDELKVRRYTYPEPGHGSWGNEETPTSVDTEPVAFIIWGTPAYPEDETYNATDENLLSEIVADYVYDIVAGTQTYTYCENFWGNDTRPEYVYGNISYCEEELEYTAIFYKGHTFCYFDCSCGNVHHRIWGLDGSDFIWDNATYAEMSSFNHDFVFLWTCVVGAENQTGDLGGIHSWGMQASWMGTTELSSDGYLDPDDSDKVFISFENVSIPFVYPTGYDTYCYGQFAYLFFDYLLNGFSVSDALDAAADDTHSASSFEDCQLYYGYYMPNPQYGFPGQPEYLECFMRVYGDGDHVLPN